MPELAAGRQRSLAARRHGGRRRDHLEPQRRRVGQGGGPPPRRTGYKPRSDPRDPLAFEGPRLRAPRSGAAGARDLRRVGTLPRPWAGSPPHRDASHRADRGAVCSVAGSPDACDPGNIEPAARGVAPGDAMDVDKIPETKASRAFRLFLERGEARHKAQGKAQGKREALLAVLAARGLSPTQEERTSIDALTDLAVLDRCIQAAVTAASVGAMLADAGTSRRRRAAPARAHKPRAVKNPARRR